VALPAIVLPFLIAIGAVGTAGDLPPVSVVNAPGLDCPQAVAVDRALAGKQGPDAPPRSASGDAWTLFLEPAGAEVRMSLRDPAGATVVSRALAAHAPGCESTAEAIAIVVERYFRDLAWTPQAGTATPRPAPSATGAEATAIAMVATPGPPPRIFLDPPRFTVGAGPALWTRTGTLAVGLDARLRVAGPVLIGLGVLLPPFRSDENLPTAPGQPQAQAQIRGVPVLVRAAVAGTRGRFGGTLGIEGLVTFEQGESRGIANPASEPRTVLAAGVALGGSVALGARFRISADLAGYRAALGRSFEIGGIAANVLEPPAWQAVFGLRLGWIVFP
jgi:hypothetical protein